MTSRTGLLVGIGAALGIMFGISTCEDKLHSESEGAKFLLKNSYSDARGIASSSFNNECGKNIFGRRYEARDRGLEPTEVTVCFGTLGPFIPPTR